MSKPRYKWWGYVKNIIRQYPVLKKEYEALHEQSVTAKATGMPGSGVVSRNTENFAIRELPYTEQREYEAVKRAIASAKLSRTANDRLALVDMVFWKRSHTLSGAAYKLNLSYTTAQRYHGEFVMSVARYYGLLDTERDGLRRNGL